MHEVIVFVVSVAFPRVSVSIRGKAVVGSLPGGRRSLQRPLDYPLPEVADAAADRTGGSSSWKARFEIRQ